MNFNAKLVSNLDWKCTLSFHAQPCNNGKNNHFKYILSLFPYAYAPNTLL